MRSWLVLTPLALAPLVVQAAPEKAALSTFEADVRPILKAHCFECHGEGPRLKGGLDLRLVRLMRQGGDSGPGVIAGQREKSPVYLRLVKGEMPPGKKLTKEEIEKIGSWIDSGARVARPEPQKLALGIYITPDEQAHWSFQPIRRPKVPAVKNSSLVRNPIDAFLLAKLEAQGLSFSPEAERRTLIRRATFDLLGLPPTPREVDAFVNDSRADAWEKVIDRLLASPHYGERWGRHWLDVAGYADSEGYSSDDAVRKSAWKYRDYVIRAFNEDMPWDGFITEQLAGDELVRPPYDQLSPADTQKLIATGFLRMAPDGTGSPGVDVKAASNQTIADTLQIVATSLLGLTLHCAQCHNHRYDPISQIDYYAFRAIFEPALNWKAWRTPAAREIALFSAAERQKADEIERRAVQIDTERLKKQAEYIEQTFRKQLAKVPEAERAAVEQAYRTPQEKRSLQQVKLLQKHPSVNVSAGSLYLYDRKAADDLKEYAARAAKLRASKPTPDLVRALTEVPGQVPTTYLFHRGDHEQPKQAVEPGHLLVLESLKLGTIPSKDPTLPTTGRRLAFARLLTSGKHPLTPRALVNRFWLHHFGRGIVNTPGDLGILGERPTHSELLDWLACEFMEGGWKLKRLHKLIMTSTAYRQSSRRTPALDKIDPDNRLVGRMNLRRLEAEAVRDAMLSVSGKLNPKPFGAPVPVMPDEFGQIVLGVDTIDGAGRRGKEVPLGDEEFRRSIYVQVRRSRPLAMLEMFDLANPAPCCELRTSSTVAPQSLLLMNSKAVLDFSKFLAERLRKEAGPDPAAQVRLAWRLVYAAEPTARDVEEALGFLQTQARLLQRSAQAEAGQLALASFCQALLGSNQFLYVD